MSSTIHAFDFLSPAKKNAPAAICVAFGDEPFLKRLVIKGLVRDVIGDGDSEIPYARLEGSECEWRDVSDELSTVSLFGGGDRLVVVEDADDFVSRYRTQLEDYVAKKKHHGVLILDVTKWASNTRLYKAIDKSGLQVSCGPPQSGGKRKSIDEAALCKWMASWSKQHHRAELSAAAADLILELVGPELGMIDQELAKLALFAGVDGSITPEMVRDVVGGWRTKTAWELMDCAADGKADQAIAQLAKLLEAGENPLALYGQIAWSLRRFATATRIFQQAERQKRRIGLASALEEAGFRKWPKEALQTAERQLKQLGRDRAGTMHRWLLDADLALKGTHSQPHKARLVLERLFVRMSRAAR